MKIFQFTVQSVFLVLAGLSLSAHSQTTLSIEHQMPRHDIKVHPSAAANTLRASPNTESCNLDFTPINYQSIGNSAGVDFVMIGSLALSKGAPAPNGRATVDFAETSILNVVSPVLQNLAASLNTQVYEAGKRNDSCNNSFGGSQVWLDAALPPRLKGKAGGTKRSCTCSTVPCPTLRQPLRTCDKCLVQSIASGEVEVGWRIDATVDAAGTSVLLPVVQEYRNSSVVEVVICSASCKTLELSASLIASFGLTLSPPLPRSATPSHRRAT